MSAALSPDTITEISLEQLHESPFNPRKVFNDQQLQELATDIKSIGRVLSPLLVRPRIPPLFGGDPEAITGYEIVFGHRRFRGATLAQLASVPCMVRSMSDEEAKRAQISENLQRADVHPIEEAEGFQALIDGHNMTADLIAEQTGKSRTYVYSRLKLLNAIPEVRKMCLAGELDAEVTLYISRLATPKHQQDAIAFIRKDYRYSRDFGDGGKQSTRHLRDLLNEKFTLNLKDAIFPLEDEMLVPLAGHCLRCVKRTGNAPEFDDITTAKAGHQDGGGRVAHAGADVCTDPTCFDEKKKAHLKRQAAALVDKGKTVVQGAKARQVIDAHGNVKNGYVALSAVKAELAKAKGTVQVVTIQNPRNGKTVQAVKVDDAKAAGVKVKEEKKAERYDYEAERKNREEEERKRDAKWKIEQDHRIELLGHVRAAIAATDRTAFDLQMMAMQMWGTVDHGARAAISTMWGHKAAAAMEKNIGSMSAPDAARLMLDCALVENIFGHSYLLNREPGNLLQAAKHYGVDVDQVRNGAGELASTPPPAARAPKKAKAAAGAKTAKAKATPAKGKSKSEEQKDDAGVAGGLFEMCESLERVGA